MDFSLLNTVGNTCENVSAQLKIYNKNTIIFGYFNVKMLHIVHLYV